MYMYSHENNLKSPSTALSECFVAVGSIEGVAGSKCQVPLPARGFQVKSSVN